MAVILEPRQPPRLRFVGIDRKSLVTTATWVGHMIGTAAQRTAIPQVQKVECQRRMWRDRRMQSGRRLPRFETDTGDGLAKRAGRVHGKLAAVASHHMPPRHEA